MWKKNILIEDITKEELKKLDVIDLRQLRSRFINLFDKHFIRYDSKTIGKMSRMKFMSQYNLLRKEMDSRGVKSSQYLPIDQELGSIILKSVMWGLDITMLNDMLMIPDYISISGKYIESPKNVKEIEVVVKNKEENRSEKFEAIVGQLIKEQVRKEPKFIYKPKGSDSSYIPIYDLILKAHEKIEKIKVVRDEGGEFDINKPPEPTKEAKKKKEIIIEKPEETDDFIRIPVGGDCKITATITIDESQGITALYCGGDKRIRTYAFDKRVKSWTMASARAWIKEHSKKTEKALGEGRGVGGERQGIGGADICVCPECGYEEKHKRDIPCADIKCPECGTPLEGKAQKQTIFKIKKVDKKQQIIGGIVYEPYEVDTQGDYTDEKEIEKAMYKFMEKYATDTKRARINHEGKRYFFPILECFQPDEDTTKGGEPLKKGSWWLMMKVPNKGIWDKIESGELTAFSMGGVAREG